MNAPCAAADHRFIRADGPVLSYLLKSSWTMAHISGLWSSLPQAPCSPARLPMLRRCFATRPMECGSSSCKTPCGVPKTTSSSSGYPDLPDDFHLANPEFPALQPRSLLPPLLNLPFSTPLSQCCDVVYAKFLEACSRQRARAADILEKGDHLVVACLSADLVSQSKTPHCILDLFLVATLEFTLGISSSKCLHT